MFKNRYNQFETETKLRRGTHNEFWLSCLITITMESNHYGQ